jgi:hypothetical protein
MSRKRKPTNEPGDICFSEGMGCLVRMTQNGEEEPFVPGPHELFPEFAPDPPTDIPIRPDGSVSPFYTLDHDQLERLGQDTPRNRRTATTAGRSSGRRTSSRRSPPPHRSRTPAAMSACRGKARTTSTTARRNSARPGTKR